MVGDLARSQTTRMVFDNYNSILQYQREMQNKMMNQSAMMSNVLQGPPPPPPDSNVPPPPPEQTVPAANYQQLNLKYVK